MCDQWSRHGWGLVGLALAALVVDTLRRVRQEERSGGVLTRRTALEVWVLYLVHAATTIESARRRCWPIDPSRRLRRCADAGLLVGGILTIAGFREFGSFSRVNGLRADKLITSGVYARSRNPQNLGWGLMLSATAVLGRSRVAIGLAAVFSCVIQWYLVTIEEPYLERRFGDAYQRYRTSTPRWLGLPANRLTDSHPAVTPRSKASSACRT